MRWGRRLAATEIFCYALLWLIVLTVVGSVAQKYVGLHEAQLRYFSSWILWLSFIPLPGGRLTMTVVFVNLLAKLVFASPLRWQRSGVIISHLGALLLLVGGFITAFQSVEGYMLIPEGEQRDYFEDHYDREIAVIRAAADGGNTVTVYKGGLMAPGKQLPLEAPAGASLTVEELHENCEPVQREGEAPADARGMAATSVMRPKPGVGDEQTRSGALLRLAGAGEEIDGLYLALEDFTPTTVRNADGTELFTVSLRPRRYRLPLTIHLDDVEMSTHPGIEMARDYRSHVTVTSESSSRKVDIWMNHPLRDSGYTFYQSSYFGGRNQATGLSVVKNAGRLFPYVSSIIICIGMLIHLGIMFVLSSQKKRRQAAAALVTILLLAVAGTAHAGVGETGAEAFGRLPIQHQGRLKPMDTFARDQLLTFHHRSSIDGRSASAWLVDTLGDPQAAMDEPLFRIRNDEVPVALGLEPATGQLYSFNTLISGMQGMLQMLHDLYRKPSADRTMIENQMVDVYVKCIQYRDLVRSLSALTPTITVNDPEIAAEFELTPGRPTSYLHFILHQDATVALFEEYQDGEEDGSPRRQALHTLAAALDSKLGDKDARNLPILPPQAGEQWLSPWEALDRSDLTEKQYRQLTELEHCLAAIYSGDPTAVNQAEAFGRLVAPDTRLDLELAYNQTKLFHRSLYCYIGAFLLLLIGLMAIPTWTRRFALILLIAGAGLHFAGLYIRMLIMGRAPVANLYETVIFVGLTAAVIGLIVEFIRKDRLGLLIATTLGAAFHFLGFRYAAEGDTMGMLLAVLDSNFWLATHVVTITIGYGAAMVAALVGHILLVQLIARPVDREQANSLLATARGTAVTALFFTTLGTILGGIWADQSWGRFWGWDPKENGALLIILWLLFVLHGRLSGMLGRPAYAATLGLTSVTVVMAWFGVNLLSVGLHNYGFSQKNLIWISALTVAELIFALVGYLLARSRQAGGTADVNAR